MKEQNTFKVGDRGKTRNYQDYEVTAVGEDFLLVKVGGKEGVRRVNGHFLDDGADSAFDLLHPTKRIQGWINFYDYCDPCFHETKEEANYHQAAKRIACIYIDVEQGEGLE